ncbi:hypothetical protein [Nitrosomonas sp. Nm34]|uniref:hypothetical protein n=1 Tax=Nitrosomonas sp. Nm34 TaxID=1881055 RepID=UPI0008EBBD6F|nr:hypothetical protein [Nitrosomonas sp. Nm34]SFJ13739.1 hypothetical protein SAMN05428978_11252 [Nitrosomonas sp. Nm34]
MVKVLDIPILNQINGIDDLKAIGTYIEVKIGIEEKIGVPLRVNGWSQLFNKIKSVSASINNNIEKLSILLCEENNLKEIGQFYEAKKVISDIFSLQIKARSWRELKLKLKKISSAFKDGVTTDKHLLFEKNKIRNFINSSKLEGIQINEGLTSRSMADVLNKYWSR